MFLTALNNKFQYIEGGVNYEKDNLRYFDFSFSIFSL